MEDFKKELNFESDTFSPVKRDMNFVMQRLLGNMQEKGATEGSMTVKIDISFDTEYIPNYDPKIEGESRKIEKPKFKHTVTSTVQIKDKKSGNMDTEMELVFDEENGEYVMKPIANTAQRTIFDDDFQDNIGSREEQKKKGEEKPASTPQLPGPTCDEAIDAEYTEVDEEPDIENEDEVEDVTDELLDGNDHDDGDDFMDGYDYEDPEEE